MEIIMEKKKQNVSNKSSIGKMESPNLRDGQLNGAIPGINNPDIAPPAFNPPVPNRAWTAMKRELEGDGLTEEERRDIIYGEEEDF